MSFFLAVELACGEIPEGPAGWYRGIGLNAKWRIMKICGTDEYAACDRSAASNTVDEILYCGKYTFEPNFRKLYPELCRAITNTVECAIKETEAGKPQKELYFRKWLDALHEDGLF